MPPLPELLTTPLPELSEKYVARAREGVREAERIARRDQDLLKKATRGPWNPERVFELERIANESRRRAEMARESLRSARDWRALATGEAPLPEVKKFWEDVLRGEGALAPVVKKPRVKGRFEGEFVLQRELSEEDVLRIRQALERSGATPAEIDDVLEMARRTPSEARELRKLARAQQKALEQGIHQPEASRPLTREGFLFPAETTRRQPAFPTGRGQPAGEPRVAAPKRKGPAFPLKRIISGAQTGADQGGLLAAVELGLERGGWVPKGGRTEKGALSPQQMQEWGLQEHASSGYPARTIQNIKESDATVVFGRVNEGGSRLTVRQAEAAGKPVIVNPTAYELRRFIVENNVGTLNVAGNRESVTKGIGETARKTVVNAVKGAAFGPRVRFMEEVREIAGDRKYVPLDELPEGQVKTQLLRMQEDLQRLRPQKGKALEVVVDPWAIFPGAKKGFELTPTRTGRRAIVPLGIVLPKLPDPVGSFSAIPPWERPTLGAAEWRGRRAVRDIRRETKAPEIQAKGPTKYIRPETGREVMILPHWGGAQFARRRADRYRAQRYEMIRAIRERDAAAWRRSARVLGTQELMAVALYRVGLLARGGNAKAAWDWVADRIGIHATREFLGEAPEGTAAGLVQRGYTEESVRKGRGRAYRLKAKGRGGEILSPAQRRQVIGRLKGKGLPGLLLAGGLGLLPLLLEGAEDAS